MKLLKAIRHELHWLKIKRRQKRQKITVESAHERDMRRRREAGIAILADRRWS